jgi:hypothetical protein
MNYSRGDYRNCDIPLWTAKAILTYAAQIEQVLIIIIAFAFSTFYGLTFVGRLHLLHRRPTSAQCVESVSFRSALFDHSQRHAH